MQRAQFRKQITEVENNCPGETIIWQKSKDKNAREVSSGNSFMMTLLK